MSYYNLLLRLFLACTHIIMECVCVKFHVLRMRKQWSTCFSNLQIHHGMDVVVMYTEASCVHMCHMHKENKLASFKRRGANYVAVDTCIVCCLLYACM